MVTIVSSPAASRVDTAFEAPFECDDELPLLAAFTGEADVPAPEALAVLLPDAIAAACVRKIMIRKIWYVLLFYNTYQERGKALLRGCIDAENHTHMAVDNRHCLGASG